MKGVLVTLQAGVGAIAKYRHKKTTLNDGIVFWLGLD
ncbi:MAG: hypothetical protein ACI9J4_001577 [Paraglaciecola sp.]|jgi:hypothetical protein